MSLSKREQRVLEQLERSLYAEDPASGADLEARVRASDIRIVAVALFPKPLIGAVVLGLLAGWSRSARSWPGAGLAGPHERRCSRYRHLQLQRSAVSLPKR